MQLILCCSALNCMAAETESRVTQLTNMQTKAEPSLWASGKAAMVWSEEFSQAWSLHVTLKLSLTIMKRIDFTIVCMGHTITSAWHLPNQSIWFKKEFVSAFYVSTLSTNRKSSHSAAADRKWKNSEKVSGQSSSIQLVSPYIIFPWHGVQCLKVDFWLDIYNL